MYEFDFERPSTVAEAVTALANEDAMALGGGQTLIPTMKMRLAGPSKLVSLAGISELQGLSSSDGVVKIGASTTHDDVANGASAYPALAALAGNIGDPAVRNRGTIGGSVANNDPSADYPAAVLASGATVNTNSRSIAADEFFQGMFDTALVENEIVTSIEFPIPDTASYQKFDQPASRFALVGVMVVKSGSNVRIAVTGASENGVYRWKEAEAALQANFDADTIADLDPDDAEMIDDLHGSSAYRANLVKVLTARAVVACS